MPSAWVLYHSCCVSVPAKLTLMKQLNNKPTTRYWDRINKPLTSDKTDILSWGFCLDFSTRDDLCRVLKDLVYLCKGTSWQSWQTQKDSSGYCTNKAQPRIWITGIVKSNLNGKICWPLRFPNIYTREITRVPQLNATVLHKVIINRYFYCFRVTIPTIPLLEGKPR